MKIDIKRFESFLLKFGLSKTLNKLNENELELFLKQMPYAYADLSDEKKRNKKFIKIVAKSNISLLRNLPEDLKNSVDFFKELCDLIKDDESESNLLISLDIMGEAVINSIEFWRYHCQKNPKAYLLLPNNFYSDKEIIKVILKKDSILLRERSFDNINEDDFMEYLSINCKFTSLIDFNFLTKKSLYNKILNLKNCDEILNSLSVFHINYYKFLNEKKREKELYSLIDEKLPSSNKRKL